MSGRGQGAISWISWFARIGWLSKGLVFVLIGAIAIRLATSDVGDADADATQAGALRVVASQPLGAVLLIVVCAGLIVFMVWNLTQAVIPDSAGTDPLGLATRIGWFGLGLFYGTVAIGGFGLAISELGSPSAGTESTNSTGASRDSVPQDLTARLLDLPGGRVVAVLIAIGILVVAGYHVHKGVTYGFVDDLYTGDLTNRWVRRLGRLGVGGFIARAFALLVVAFFLAKAAIEFDSDEAVGLDGALREFVELTFGRIVIVIVGLGLLIAGLYDMVTFRRQRLR